MKRFYLSKIAQHEEPGIGTYWAHALQVAFPGVEYVGGEIPTDPQTGEPLHPALLVMVGGVDHRALAAHQDLIPLPDMPVDAKLEAVETPKKTATKARIRAELGESLVDTETAWANTNGMRSLINFYGRRYNAPDFDVDFFDLTDV